MENCSMVLYICSAYLRLQRMHLDIASDMCMLLSFMTTIVCNVTFRRTKMLLTVIRNMTLRSMYFEIIVVWLSPDIVTV